VAPSTDSGAFTANGSAALGSALSETRTSALALRARLGERVTQQLADVVVTGNEEAMGPIVDSFAVVAHDTGEYADLVDRLERTASSLQQLETDLEAPPGDAR
jgi:aromatic ring-cleaving dioxygenase